jgi:hypothetical protein
MESLLTYVRVRCSGGSGGVAGGDGLQVEALSSDDMLPAVVALTVDHGLVLEGPLAHEPPVKASISEHAISLATLPPLLLPNCSSSAGELPPSVQMRVGCAAGWCQIVWLAALHSVALTLGRLPSAAWWACALLISLQLSIQLVCFYGMYCLDPGFVERTEDNIKPIPPEILAILQTLPAASNPQEVKRRLQLVPNFRMTAANSSSLTYCTRCLLWRPDHPPDSPLHSNARNTAHCPYCQRCVWQHDHHCAAMGRCVAGPVPAPRHMVPQILVKLGLCCCSGESGPGKLPVWNGGGNMTFFLVGLLNWMLMAGEGVVFVTWGLVARFVS